MIYPKGRDLRPSAAGEQFMVAFALLFFLLLISVITAVAIIVALKTVDFFDATYGFYRRTEQLDKKIDEIALALRSSDGAKKE